MLKWGRKTWNKNYCRKAIRRRAADKKKLTDMYEKKNSREGRS